MKENLMVCQGKLKRILCSRRKWIWCMEEQHAWTEATESPFSMSPCVTEYTWRFISRIMFWFLRKFKEEGKNPATSLQSKQIIDRPRSCDFASCQWWGERMMKACSDYPTKKSHDMIPRLFQCNVNVILDYLCIMSIYNLYLF